jgi:type VI secretion system protein ImpF
VSKPPLFFLAMQRFQPSFLDRLSDRPEPQRRQDAGLSLDEVRERVSRDLEALLNTRCGLAAGQLDAYPRCRESVLGFGLRDFSSMSLVKPEDRADICRALERSVTDHEPRLKHVRVQLSPEARDSKRLCFHIHALLSLNELREPINFNATLHPVTQQYDVARL